MRRNEFGVIADGNPLPYFDRTRTVLVFEQSIEGRSYVGIRCDCNFLMRKGHACRHVYCALKFKPSADHAFPECLKAYETFMFKHDAFTAKCHAKKELFLSKGCLMVEGTLDEVCKEAEDIGGKPLDWYLEAKGKTIDVNSQSNMESFGCSDDNDSDDDNILLKDLLTRTDVSSGKRKLSAYDQNIKEFSDVCNLVDVPDEGVRRIFEEGFSDIRRKLLLYQREKQVIQGQGMASFKNITKVKKTKRQKPVGSPRRKHR